MARCINRDGSHCPYLKFNQKGNFAYHCNWNQRRPVQVPDEDLKDAKIKCPMDLYSHLVRIENART